MVALLLGSCTGKRVNFDRGIIPPVPVSFSSVNSAFDDYNSDLRITWAEQTFSLFFSSNRNSFGDDFDVVSYIGTIYFDLIDGTFTMNSSGTGFDILETLNSSSNEFGPFFTDDEESDYPEPGDEGRFFFSSDRNGTLDIFCCRYNYEDVAYNPVGEPFPLDNLNTEYDEGYLTIHYDEVADHEVVYFTSDRDGTFDIWRATGEAGSLIDESSPVNITSMTQLNSSADDKCPYIDGNVMVFASDREGGYGGFDLWYSVWDGQQWMAPVNFGDKINTEYDEYRPVMVITDKHYFLNDMMIFSSDRPGGKGGFDLYYVGISGF